MDNYTKISSEDININKDFKETEGVILPIKRSLISLNDAIETKKNYIEAMESLEYEIRLLKYFQNIYGMSKKDISDIQLLEDESFMDRVYDFGKSLVCVSSNSGDGSGFLAGESEKFLYILTAGHCVFNYKKQELVGIRYLQFFDCNVNLSDKSQIIYLVFKSDDYDLAIVVIEKIYLKYPENYKFPIVTFDENRVNFNTHIIKYGNTLGYGGAFSFGSSIDYSEYGMRSWCIVNNGDSGGFITDFNGNVLGIMHIACKHSREVAYSVPSCIILSEIEKLKEDFHKYLCDLNLKVVDNKMEKSLEVPRKYLTVDELNAQSREIFLSS